MEVASVLKNFGEHKKIIASVALILAVVLFLVFRSSGPDPENVAANDEGPMPEAATAAAQAAAYAGQAANTASLFSLLTEGSSSLGWERVSQAWEEVIQTWEEADSIVAYYRAEAAAARAVELARSAFDRESDNAEFLYEKARFDEDYGAAGESLAVETAARAVVAAAEAALRASNDAIEAAEHAKDERPGDAFDSVRETEDWAIEAAKAADEALWQSSAEGIEAAVAEEEAAVRAAAEVAAAEEEAAVRAAAEVAAAEEEAAAAYAAAIREEVDAMADQAAGILAEAEAAAAGAAENARAAADSAKLAEETAEEAGPAARAAAAGARGAAEDAESAAEAAAQSRLAVESAVAEISTAAEAVSTTTDQEELDNAHTIAFDAFNVIFAIGRTVPDVVASAERAAAQAQANVRATEAEIRAEQEGIAHAVTEAQHAYQAQEAAREVVSRRGGEYLVYSPREWRTAEDLSRTDYETPIIAWVDSVRTYADAMHALAALDPAYTGRALATEEYATASQAVLQAAQRLDDAIYEVDRYGQNDRDALNHVSQLGAITPVVAGAAVRADTHAPDYAATVAAQWASAYVAQHYAHGRAITGQ